jgi:glucokinase
MEKTYIGVDLGGTKVLAARVNKMEILETEHRYLPADNGDQNVVIGLIKEVISDLIDPTVQGIGVGIPSLVDYENGIISKIQNIPSWKNVHLTEILTRHFKIPAYIQNDANCFALGEAYFGMGQDCDHFVGITIGTGLGGGLVYKSQLLEDSSNASGEFGMLPYLDKTLEDYCSGRFFKNQFGIGGAEAAEKAHNGDPEFIEAWKQFGFHLGNALKIIISTIDPKKIIMGGSVALSRELFEKSMLQSLHSFPFRRSIDNLKVEFSKTNNMGVLGAASLCYQNNANSDK